MTERINQQMLDRKIELLNKITGSPAKPYRQEADGRYYANPGNFHIDSAYGGYALHRMSNESGGAGYPHGFPHGYFNRRELFEYLCAFIAGIELAQREARKEALDV